MFIQLNYSVVLDVVSQTYSVKFLPNAVNLKYDGQSTSLFSKMYLYYHTDKCILDC